MIKASELRIDNHFYDEDNDIAVVTAFMPHERSLVKNNFRFSDAGCIIIYDVYTEKGLEKEFTISTELATPIPITSEWLERCGFKIPTDDGFFVRMARGVVCIKISDIGLPIVRIGEMHFTNIIHLHQLQNLYHAFTGEELIITL